MTALFPPDCDFRALVRLVIESLGAEALIGTANLDEEDWVNAWRRNPTTRRFGRRLIVSAADAPSMNSGTVTVRLTPGLAFGTGGHPTTALCLRWLDANPPTDARVLDYGCGSGILAIAALKLGARRAWAVDVENQALTATQQNATVNAVTDRLWVGRPEALVDLQVDVLVANILAQPLENLAAQFGDYLVPGGRLVLSGILESQTERLEAAISPWFGPSTCEAQEGWMRVSAPRHGG